jgi:electron transfer flavoprotein alpha subunit
MTPRVLAIALMGDIAGIDAHDAALAAARAVGKQSGARVEAILIGQSIERAPEGFTWHAFTHASLSDEASPQQWAEATAAALSLIASDTPTLVLAPPGPFGDEFAACLSVTADLRPLGRCETIAFEQGALRAARSGFGGRVSFVTEVSGEGCVATMRAPRDSPPIVWSCNAAPGPIILDTPLSPSLNIQRTPLSERKRALEGARIVVSGGRGLDASGFQLLEEIAESLDGALGASLAAIDLGLAPVSRQVGQSGKFVTPAIYLAVGLSGTPQHLAGIGAASRIFAINNDPEASIFDFAELGIVGDWRETLPLLKQALAEAR